MNINLYLITSDRRIISDTFEGAGEPENVRSLAENNADPIAIARARYLESALNFAARWVRSQMISASNTGAKNSNDIYSDIVTQLANVDLQGASTDNIDLAKLTKKLRDLRSLSRSYAAFGLMPSLRIKKLTDALDNTTGTSQIAIKLVMEPYVGSLQARLDALAPVYNSIKTFIGNLNEFFSYKSISFKAGKGFEITNEWGNVLSTDQLSSGEQQLLLIFCYALAAGDKSSVLIIDEPEISLNVEWQRRLIDALRKITESSKNQLVFATHSIELLAQHSENVWPLNPITIRENDPVYEHTSTND